MKDGEGIYILGGGMTGLAAGMVSGLPVLEAADAPGGICSSYYIRPGEKARLNSSPQDGEAYRFEHGGGHWIFGGDSLVLKFIEGLTPLKRYERSSAVYFAKTETYVPYPLQNNLRFLDKKIIEKSLAEVGRGEGPFRTMGQWIAGNFGATLSELFFEPFHDLYTAGLHTKIAPQDAYKSPVSRELVEQGAKESAPPVGYNTTFAYPIEGLNALSQKMAERTAIQYSSRVVNISPKHKTLQLESGQELGYRKLLSTLPLNRMLELCEVAVQEKEDPFTSVLVLNIGAKRGAKCPDHHWHYNPDAEAGFHRVGFYSNVDVSFLPASYREKNAGVSIYVERAYVGGEKPEQGEIDRYAQAVVAELQSWGYIDDAEVVDPTWIDVAYTWKWPDSNWQHLAVSQLESNEIYPIGRYGRWLFQGIADSIRDGFFAGASLR